MMNSLVATSLEALAVPFQQISVHLTQYVFYLLRQKNREYSL
jgi:hypothetical protein